MKLLPPLSHPPHGLRALLLSLLPIGLLVPDAGAQVLDFSSREPGWYPATGSTPAMLVMPTIRKAPERPADVQGADPGSLPPETANAKYTAHCFMPFFAGGGSLPASRESGDPAIPMAVDVYKQLIEPVEISPGDPPAKVTHLTLQHCYAASFDLDLAPTGDPAVTHPFAADGFNDAPAPPFLATDFTGADNVNDQGFRQEDFSYALPKFYWGNTRMAGEEQPPKLEYFTKPEPIIWGNIVAEPMVDWAAQPQKSKDNLDFTFAASSDDFHPHAGRSSHPDAEAALGEISHYRMTCFIGGSAMVVLTAPLSATSVRLAKPSRLSPEDPNAPALVASSRPVARNLFYQLHTGGLGSQPVAP